MPNSLATESLHAIYKVEDRLYLYYIGLHKFDGYETTFQSGEILIVINLLEKSGDVHGQRWGAVCIVFVSILVISVMHIRI